MSRLRGSANLSISRPLTLQSADVRCGIQAHIVSGLSGSREATHFELAPGVKVVGMEVFPGVSMDPDVRFGKPCLSGTRIDVATIVGALAAGESADTVAAEYSLSVDQVRTALAYAAHVAAHLPPAVRQVS
jgi:uncharacterized protein (DUF433 family)